MIAVATENRSLLIYHNSTLVWCAELADETIAIKRGNFVSLTGALVTMNATGKISVGYLGSDPIIFKVPPMNLSKLDYDRSKTELEEMEREISSSVDNSGKKINKKKAFTIIILFPSLDVPFINAAAEKDLQIKSYPQFENLENGEFCKLQMKLLATVNLEQVQILVTPNSAFSVPENVLYFKDLRAQEKHLIEVKIFLSDSQISEIFLREISIMVSFINKQCIARVIKHVVEIPLRFVLTKGSPQKDSLYKVTLSVSSPINFSKFFEGGKLKLISFKKLF